MSDQGVATRFFSPALTSSRRQVTALATWLAVIVTAYLWGTALISDGMRFGLYAPPLFGRFDFDPSAALLIPVALAGAIVALWSSPKSSLQHLLLWSAGLAGAWTVSLALEGGLSALTEPLGTRWEVLRAVPLVASPVGFLDSFVANIADYPLHVQGHPPGVVLGLWALDRLGAGGTGPAAAFVITAGISAVPATLIVTDRLAGREEARRVAPFLVLTPAAVWVATSMDALYLGVSAWGVACFAVACTSSGSRSNIAAGLAGALLGGGLLLSYGLATVGIVVVTIAAMTRSVRQLVIAGSVAAAVVALPAAFGFWWFDGLAATIDRYHLGISSRRPDAFFAFNNIAACAVAIGPAAVAGALHLGPSKLRYLVMAGWACVLAASISGLSQGEVERIWLPFVPYVSLAAAALPDSTRRIWLAGQAVVALAVQAGVTTPW